MGIGERRTPAGRNLPTFPASALAVAARMAPAPSRASDLLTCPVSSVIVAKTLPPSRAPSPETLCTTGPMAPTRASTRSASTRPSPARQYGRRRSDLVAVAIGASTFALCLLAAALVAVFASGPPERASRRAERRMEVMLSPPAATPRLMKAERTVPAAPEPTALRVTGSSQPKPSKKPPAAHAGHARFSASTRRPAAKPSAVAGPRRPAPPAPARPSGRAS